MKQGSIAISLPVALATLMLGGCGGGANHGAAAAGYRVLHAFDLGDPPHRPCYGVVAGADGTLYGLSCSGGQSRLGTAYTVDPASGVAAVLFSFGLDPAGPGQKPVAALVSDRAGNLYGTTTEGGATHHGTVFKIDAKTHAVTLLHAFTGGPDGAIPSAGLSIDAQGNLFGNTRAGGSYDDGTVFEISPTGIEQVIYSFNQSITGAPYHPRGALALDGSGHLYGTTSYGGTANLGTVYELTPGLNSTPATLTVLHSFAGGGDGAYPIGGVVLDATHKQLYGTTTLGGSNDNGTVFACPVDGSAAQLVYAFQANGSGDGATPAGALVIDDAGVLYGTTENGGVDDRGTVFALDPSSKVETVLHRFSGSATGDGAMPNPNLLIDAAGQLVGTTQLGGTNDVGTVFTLPR